MKCIFEELVKPTPKKFLIFFVISIYLISSEYTDRVWCFQGLPIPVYQWCGPESITRDHAYFLYYFLIVDIVIWYILACLLSWFLTLIYGKYSRMRSTL